MIALLTEHQDQTDNNMGSNNSLRAALPFLKVVAQKCTFHLECWLWKISAQFTHFPTEQVLDFWIRIPYEIKANKTRRAIVIPNLIIQIVITAELISLILIIRVLQVIHGTRLDPACIVIQLKALDQKLNALGKQTRICE